MSVVTAVHLIVFLSSIGILTFFAGILVESVDFLAKRLGRSGFTVAFFVLGALTAVDEFSVMVNSSLAGVPQISAGNLIGSSFVILILVIPLLAVFGNGVRFKDRLDRKQMLVSLFVILLPALLVLDGDVRAGEGVLALLAYVSLIYFIRDGRWWWQKKGKPAVQVIVTEKREIETTRKGSVWFPVVKILGGAIAIFFAGNLLVEEANYFSDLLSVPNSLIGLVILSIGTKAPEIAIAIRAINKDNIGIAFGNYMGSAVAMTALFGMLALFNGSFDIEASNFHLTIVFMIIGLFAFYFFSNSKNDISRKEGALLILLYSFFLFSQVASVIWFN